MRRAMPVVALVLACVLAACMPSVRRLEQVDLGADGRGAPLGVIEPAAIDDAGGRVAFTASDFLDPADHEGIADAYVRDRRTGRTILASVAPNGYQGNGPIYHPAISGDGATVAYLSSYGGPLPLPTDAAGTNLYVRDVDSGALERIVVPGDGTGYSSADSPKLDRDGDRVAFNWSRPVGPILPSVWLDDRSAGTVVPVATGPDGEPVRAYVSSITDDGRSVAYSADASQILPVTSTGFQLLLRDTATGETRIVSSDASGAPLPGGYDGRVSGDGTAAVVWQIAPPYAVFHKDLRTGALRRVDQRGCRSGAESTDYAWASITDDGRTVVFQSDRPDLVANDRNGHEDVFLWTVRTPCRVALVSRAPHEGSQGDGDSYWPEISGNGRSVAFVSAATNFAPGDTNAHPDAFVADLTR